MNQLKRQRPREKRKARQSGQGLLEYVLAILLMVFTFQLMNSAIKRGVGNLWLYLAKNIAAGCPVPSAGSGCQDSIPEELK